MAEKGPITFSQFAAKLVGEDRIIIRTVVSGNKITLQLLPTYVGGLVISKTRETYEAEFDSAPYFLRPPGDSVSHRRLAGLAKSLGCNRFDGNMRYEVNPEVLKLTGLSPLENYLSAYATESRLFSGYRWVHIEPISVSGNVLASSKHFIEYEQNPDLTRARFQGTQEFREFLSSHDLFQKSETVKNLAGKDETTVKFKRKPSLADLESFEEAHLENSFSTTPRTTLMFSNPSLENLSKVDDIYSQSLAEADVRLHTSSGDVSIKFRQSYGLCVEVPSLEVWNSLSGLGSVNVFTSKDDEISLVKRIFYERN